MPENVCQIAVAQLEYGKARRVFEAGAGEGLICLSAPAQEEELARFIVEHRIQHAVVGVERYAGPLYDALPRGGVLARFGVGHDGIDKERATSRGILCTNTPGVLDDSVAELTVGLMLAAARHLPDVSAATGAGTWGPRVGSELRDKTLAVIGCGAIGRRVARIAARGLGMHVVGCEVVPVDKERLRIEYGFAEIRDQFADAVADADYVTLHIPSTADTRHYVNHARLALMKPCSWLINTARGALVCEADLYDALSAGRITGAALDVFEHEPYQPIMPDKDLRQLPRVIMSPHIGSSTQEACDRMASRALTNIRMAEAGEFATMDLLNPAVLNRKEHDPT
ncbi:MAG: hypothetical protein GXY55_01325 [Phycisphaerae bacterium]|nr:hypothetical protein [Phycisphaerae bacterium]